MPYTLILVVLVALVLYLVSIFNKFKTIEVRIRASIQEIGNQLKRQAEMIPNLVASVKGYMKHEQKALDKITEARKMALSAVSSGSAKGMVEAAGPTKQLMDELRDTADKVMYSRRTLIDLTADYNVMVVTFPTNLIANML